VTASGSVDSFGAAIPQTRGKRDQARSDEASGAEPINPETRSIRHETRSNEHETRSNENETRSRKPGAQHDGGA
jgi:hypothetical protein